FLIGAPGGLDGLPTPLHGVQDDPAYRTLYGSVNARKTLLAGFTTVRNLGLMVKTGGYLLDVALQRAIDQGWLDGPRIVPAGHAITPYGGHLDPTVFQRMAPGVMPLSVAEGIANGVSDVRACVRYQIRHGAKVIKISASGGVMSHSTGPGAQQYSDEELTAIADEAHRSGIRVAAHAIGDAAIRACIRAGVDCIEHGFLAEDETIQLMVDHGTFLVSTTSLTDAMAIERADPEKQKKAAEVFPRAKAMLPKAIAAGVKIACGTDAPAIPHGHNANELVALVNRGMTPGQALRAATVTSAELIQRDDELGRLAPGYLADVIGVAGDPTADITTLQDVPFVMKDGRVHANR
ncbi:MAG TPA: amidohydrolase family protein, partial [Mycobacteriales bacterium]|nr:amidohydrolase family protein [Mycobacteriales bacterium]